MKDMRHKTKSGITLLELLIVISLTGLIFTLGIHPVLSQLRLTNVERSEIELFDDANLAVFYISTDAMKAEDANDSTANQITFTINAVSLGIGTVPTLRTLHTVRYYPQNGNTELWREHLNDTGGTVSNRRITARLYDAKPPDFNVDTENFRSHRLITDLHFENAQANLFTQRAFEVELRSRDARL